jgi:glycosyltransferase involved in cell wall biosynthesis
MKILMCHNNYRTSAPSGEDAVVQDERELLEKYGIEVILYEKYNDDLDDSTLFKRINVALDTSWSRKTYHELRKIIRKTRPDIAHFHNTFPQISPSAYLACQENGVPVVQTLHNFRFVCPGAMLLRDGQPCERCLGTSLLPALKYRCYRNSTTATAALVLMLVVNRLRGSYQNLVNRYIALTEFAAGRLVAGGLPKERVVVKPNYIGYIPGQCSDKQSYAVFVGRLKSEKGLHTLLQAWRKLPDVPLKIIGDGELRGELESQVTTEGLRVEFLGQLPRKAVLEQVSQAAIQIVPSQWYEGFPLVILEAYSCGTPVVASRIGSLNELVEENRSGVKFEAGNANDLADKVRGLWDSGTRLQAMGVYARDLVCARYNGEKNYQQLMQIYEQATEDFSASSYANSAKTVRFAGGSR